MGVSSSWKTKMKRKSSSFYHQFHILILPALLFVNIYVNFNITRFTRSLSNSTVKHVKEIILMVFFSWSIDMYFLCNFIDLYDFNDHYVTLD